MAHRAFIVSVCLLGLAIAASASAQPAARSLDASVGYQLLHIPDETFPFGLNFDVAAEVAPQLKAIGEFGWAHDSQNEVGVSGTLNFINIGGGARWSLASTTVAGSRRLDPYVQLVAGAVHAGADLNVGGVTADSGTWAFMLQPGAGVSIPFSPAMSVLGQVDYRRAFFDNGENEVRFVVGVRISPR